MTLGAQLKGGFLLKFGLSYWTIKFNRMPLPGLFCEPSQFSCQYHHGIYKGNASWCHFAHVQIRGCKCEQLIPMWSIGFVTWSLDRSKYHCAESMGPGDVIVPCSSIFHPQIQLKSDSMVSVMRGPFLLTNKSQLNTSHQRLSLLTCLCER